jgi:iron only hydrogenase large subunit-like protein
VRVCEEVVTVTALDFVSRGRNTHVGTSLDKDFNISSCINCGQCLLVCPTGALQTNTCTAGVLDLSAARSDTSCTVSLWYHMPFRIVGVRYSRDFDRVVNSILRKMGFDLVFNAGFAADIYIHELASVLAKRTGKDSDNPIYLSACPAWIKYAEQYATGILPVISTLKPPQQIAGALIKSFIAENMDVNPENIYCLSVTPCIAMKYEADRDGNVHKGISEVDNVVTVMELARLIRLFGIDIDTVSGDNADEPMSMRSSAALLTEVSGGCTEAVGRSLHYINGDRDPGRAFFRKARSGQGFREIQLESGGKNYTFAVVDGLANMKKLNAKISEGRKYDLIEIMVCPGGCINGGGLSFSSSKEIIRNRARMVYQAEESEAVPVPSKSPALVSFFKEMEGKGRDNEYVALLHTKYNQRNVLL